MEASAGYKGRLVGKGYIQRYGVDYQETFAPVAKLDKIRILISITANREGLCNFLMLRTRFSMGSYRRKRTGSCHRV